MTTQTSWITRQTRERPFFSALVVLIIVMVPGYARLETTLNTANHAAQAASEAASSASDTATQLKTITENEQIRNQVITLGNCQTRNTATKNGRDRFVTFFTVIEAIFTSNPGATEAEKQQGQAFIDKIRAGVPLDPSEEDIDCDKNGTLGPEDYSK